MPGVRGGAGGEGGRMIRRLFTVLRLLSLVLLVATVAAWVRSYRVGDRMRVNGSGASGGLAGDRGTDLWASWGLVKLERAEILTPATPATADVADNDPFSSRSWDVSAPEPIYFLYPYDFAAHFAGLRVGTRYQTTGPYVLRGWGVIVPLWLPALLLATPTVVTLWSRRRRKAEARAGLGPACGYDLRATPDRCPECGAVPAGNGAA
jgi:hypothetical protein